MLATMETCKVPVIDLDQEDEEVAGAIRAACLRHGFFVGTALACITLLEL